MSELEKAEHGIITLLKAVEERDAFDNPVALSNIMARLAHFNHTVGRNLARLQTLYKQKRADTYKAEMKREKATATNAKQVAEQSALDEEQQYDHYKNLHDDTTSFITVCQSHLRILGLEAKSQL